MPPREHFRAHARRRIDQHATVRSATGAHAARVRDLGLGGACLEVADPGASIDVGATLSIEITAPTLWDPLVLSGTVAWVRRGAVTRPLRAGLRFEHGDASMLYALFQLLGTRAYDP
jgi:hypothetical protein